MFSFILLILVCCQCTSSQETSSIQPSCFTADRGNDCVHQYVNQLQQTIKSLQHQNVDEFKAIKNQLATFQTETLAHISSLEQNITGLENKLSMLERSVARDCADLYNSGSRADGVYAIYPSALNTYIQVYCEMSSDGGGWTVLQRRTDGSVSFRQNWQSYKEGFGDLNGDFWLGNDFMSALTAQKTYQLRVDLGDWEGQTRYATYSVFRIHPESDFYKLDIGGYSGTAGDSLRHHNGLKFSTYDRDHDTGLGSCSVDYGGSGFWFAACFNGNLNGPHQTSSNVPSYAQGVMWEPWHGHYYSLKTTVIKIKPLHD